MSPLEPFVRYIPPLFAIFLILVSGLAAKFLAHRITTFIAASSDAGLKEKSVLIKNMVLSGTTQVSIFNSMFAALISAVVIGWKSLAALICAVVIVGIFVIVILWTLSFDPDDLADKRFAAIPVKYSLGCKTALIAVNLILCVVIWLSSRS